MIKNNYVWDVKYNTSYNNQCTNRSQIISEPKNALIGAYFLQGLPQKYKKKQMEKLS